MSEVITHPIHTAAPEPEPFLYGIIAEFDHPDALIEAANRTRLAGYKKVDAYTPFPVEGLSEAMDHRDNWVPMLMLLGGILGFFGGMALLVYCMFIEYPLNIGGRPINMTTWPHLMPIAFECTVLFSALTGVASMFAINGLPQPYHPVFDAPEFSRASSDRFFLCIEATDPQFDREATRRFMDSYTSVGVSEVELRK